MVDIGYSHLAILPSLSFENVTKKNAPKFEYGEIVAAYIVDVPESGEVLLSCIGRNQKEKLGKLIDGTLIRMRPNDINKIIEFNFLELISKKVSLSSAKGENGRLWFNTGKSISCIQLNDLIKKFLILNFNQEDFLNNLNKINF